jgi:hypothetical protein
MVIPVILWRVGCDDCWFVGLLVRWLVGWLVGWLVDELELRSCYFFT